MTDAAYRRLDARTKALVKQARKARWEVSITSKSHVRFVSPEGKVIIASGVGHAFPPHLKKTEKRLQDAGLS